MKRVERVQAGVRIERRILKVSKAVAELLDMPLGELLEGVLLHSFEGKAPFGESTLKRIGQLREAYGLDLPRPLETAEEQRVLSGALTGHCR